ncbi:carbohydrate-binding family 9-like protein [Mucilaginibacter sp. cycad4]|uniref:carbohydrate-binding family 9-like protein n=1 Tax=Mucilaginibacter sp. cycad4 TaxID=3342096 RepID=UPI002AABAE24|nr:carbohydrate-binding family 9-like protein [Mucilaginibacter gossypii]WPV01990.1 carbohydrate-binding family 9-like protein [Mucilaginibacter gossypii]
MALTVAFLEDVDKGSPIEHMSVLLDEQEKHLVGIVPWPDYEYKPDVHFAIAYSTDCFMLKYYVKEKAIKASYYRPNEPVHQDSCVEFFIGFGTELEYYNFGFNCIGTCSLGFGRGRENREVSPEKLIRLIKSQTRLTQEINHGNGDISWELTLMLPLDVFYHHSFTSLKGQQCHANFYKCGDELPEPHFLTWHNIECDDPDFHHPEFFGEIKLEV